MIRWPFLAGVLSIVLAGRASHHAAVLNSARTGPDSMANDLNEGPLRRSRLLPIQYTSPERDVPSATGTAGDPIALRIEIPAEFRKAQFLAIRGVPREISLSAGFRAGAAWYLPSDKLSDLELSSPTNFTGNFVFEATLFKELQGGPIGQIYITVVIRASRPAGADRAATSALGQTPRTRARRPPSSADEQASLARGMALVWQGDVVTARMVFLDLAKRGSSRGARAMGETYDPTFLSRVFIAGLRPDPGEASKWYSLAIEMGDEEAEERLGRLGPRKGE